MATGQLFVKQLTVVDFAYLEADRGLLGESWWVDITLGGMLNAQGMVFDFAEVKKQVKRLIDAEFDHRLLVPAQAPQLFILQTEPQTQLRFETTRGETIQLSAPAQAVAFLPATAITPATLASALIDQLRPCLPPEVYQIELQLYPECLHETDAYFHYSHGLRQHEGNCQRIAHGHRSRLEIITNQQRNSALEQEWAARWRDIYIATRQDCIAEFIHNGQPYWQFAYTAAQGRFELSLPAARCYLVEQDSTIENLANHVCAVMTKADPHTAMQVRLFEGINKGAVAINKKGMAI